ncbi:MAG: aminotransferase class V-fold PLP-dependent enzyme [Thermomicrobiales bacterium]|nr:aminotransferase class V-fold PLP-dependent enzyme [Thermomicrobiales bacterium]
MPDPWSEAVAAATARIAEWEALWPAFDGSPTLALPEERTSAILADLGERLRENSPFFHPSYAGQMLKPPHPIAAAAYAMAQRINPNNHALDGGPATAHLEIEVVRDLASMIGFDPLHSLGHLTSSGTIANLEALWVARESHPEKGILCSDAAHYTHQRMAHLLRMPVAVVGADPTGRMDLDALETGLAGGNIGTVVATAGTTATGAVDDIAAIVELASAKGVRVHVDAAYGGFFRLLAGADDDALRTDTAAAFRAIARADSVVIDPHKHGLQPYGCGSVLFRDPAVGRFYAHDSPYTYFTSSELHLGEISLECSRAGAAAAALWATLQAFPLRPDGLGAILRQTRHAAVTWASLLRDEPNARLIVDPELDIITFYLLPESGDWRTSAISALTQERFDRLMSTPRDPVYLATLRVPPAHLGDHDLEWDSDTLLAFRSVLMKPEHLDAVPALHDRVVRFTE